MELLTKLTNQLTLLIMKSIKILSKSLILCTVLFLNTSANSQTSKEEQGKFVRVYNLKGKKINKGRVVYINDSILGLKKGDKFVKVSINGIGQIKTKRSSGNSVLTASLIGGTAGALIGAATSQEQTKTGNNWLFGEYQYTTGTSPGTGAAIVGGVGLIGGALIGLGSSLFKKQETFVINGDINKWSIFKELIENNNLK